MFFARLRTIAARLENAVYEKSPPPRCKKPGLRKVPPAVQKTRFTKSSPRGAKNPSFSFGKNGVFFSFVFIRTFCLRVPVA